MARYPATLPDHVIYARHGAEPGTVAILGHLTGSHLRLPDAEQRPTTLIRLSTVVHGVVMRWRFVEDTSVERLARGLADTE